MSTTPTYQQIDSAYQLHFYFSFKTKYLRKVIVDQPAALIENVARRVCERQQFHLLEMQTTPDHVRMLVSLQPNQTVSHAVKMLKGNISREFSLNFPDTLRHNRMKTVWADGYFAQTSGTVDLQTVRRYIESQASHHGYRGTWTDGLRFRNSSFAEPAFRFNNSLCLLKYHFVFSTRFRKPIFDETLARRLFEHIMAIGIKRQFAVDRVTVLPDHMHLLIAGVPTRSADEYALCIANNTEHWLAKHYWGAMKQLKIDQVWQPSYYVGSVGEYNTAQFKSFLSGSNSESRSNTAGAGST